MPERERDAANRHCARHAGLKQQRLAHGGVQVVAAEDARAAKRARQPAARRAAVGDRPRLPHSVVDARCHLCARVWIFCAWSGRCGGMRGGMCGGTHGGKCVV
eukprot:360629-Chlamydomonas_euryale.AAC.1